MRTTQDEKVERLKELLPLAGQAAVNSALSTLTSVEEGHRGIFVRGYMADEPDFYEVNFDIPVEITQLEQNHNNKIVVSLFFPWGVEK